MPQASSNRVRAFGLCRRMRRVNVRCCISRPVSHGGVIGSVQLSVGDHSSHDLEMGCRHSCMLRYTYSHRIPH